MNQDYAKLLLTYNADHMDACEWNKSVFSL